MNTRKILEFSIGPVSSALIGLITLPIIAWKFSPEDIGRLTMLQVTCSFALMLFSLGLDQAFVREFHEVKDKPSHLKAVFLPGFFIMMIFLFGMVFIPWSPSLILFGIESQFLTILLVSAICFSFGSRFLSLILRMEERGLSFSMCQLLPKLMFMIIVVGYLVFGTKSIFDNLMIANVISLLIMFIVCLWTTRKVWIEALSAKINKSKQAEMISYSIPLVGSGLAFWALTSIDRVFLRNLSNFEELGIYSVAFNFASVALVLQMIFSTIWVPVVYKWESQGIEPKKIKNVIEYVIVAIVMIWTLSGIFSWTISYILPPEYNDIQTILLAGMAYPLLYTLSEATGIGIGIKRKTIFSLLAALFALVVNVISNWLLIPAYGASGAAVASALSFYIFFLIKTEISARIWMKIERVKMYFTISLLLFFSCYLNIISNQAYITVLCYLVLLSLMIILYRKTLINIYRAYI